jgi:hypothetical protein
VLSVHGDTTILGAGSVALLLVAAAPRAGWLLMALAGVVWLALLGKLGVALLALVVFAPSVVLLSSTPWLWSAPALAPALGPLGLAAAFPAFAARIGGDSAWQRAIVAALGYWWLAVVEALTGRRLLFGVVTGARPRASWEQSAPAAVDHVLAGLCTPGRLAPALLWAIAAVVLPWVLGRSAGVHRTALALAWAGALLITSLLLAHRIGTPSPPLPLAAAALAAAGALSVRHRRSRLPARPGVA